MRRPSACCAIACTTRSNRLRCTYSRELALHTCPWLKKMPIAAPATTASGSASGSTIIGRLAAQLEREARHAVDRRVADRAPGRRGAGEADLVDARVRGQRRAGLAAAAHDVECTGGQAGLGGQCARRSAVSGVSGEGFSTTVQPAASAGAIFHSAIASGKFHGTIGTHHAHRLALRVGVIARTGREADRRLQRAAFELGGPAGHVAHELGGEAHVDHARHASAACRFAASPSRSARRRAPRSAATGGTAHARDRPAACATTPSPRERGARRRPRHPHRAHRCRASRPPPSRKPGRSPSMRWPLAWIARTRRRWVAVAAPRQKADAASCCWLRSWGFIERGRRWLRSLAFSASMNSAPRSAIMIVGALVLPLQIVGITDASQTRSRADAAHAQLRVDDGHRSRAHAAGAHRVIDGLGVLAHELLELGVGHVLARAGVHLLGDHLAHRRHAQDAARQLQAAHERVDVFLRAQEAADRMRGACIASRVCARTARATSAAGSRGRSRCRAPRASARSTSPTSTGSTWNWMSGRPCPAVSTKPPLSTTLEVSSPVLNSSHCSPWLKRPQPLVLAEQADRLPAAAVGDDLEVVLEVLADARQVADTVMPRPRSMLGPGRCPRAAGASACRARRRSARPRASPVPSARCRRRCDRRRRSRAALESVDALHMRAVDQRELRIVANRREIGRRGAAARAVDRRGLVEAHAVLAPAVEVVVVGKARLLRAPSQRRGSTGGGGACR